MKTTSDLSSMRISYTQNSLCLSQLSKEPVEQFSSWLSEAMQANLPEPYAMQLATASNEGRPSLRTVLLRGFSSSGLVFYSNFLSHKGRDLSQNPCAEVLFYWAGLERQVRAYGSVQRLSSEESDLYFASRPRQSQIAAHASSPQSAPIASRELLEARVLELEKDFAEPDAVPRPDFWGGYIISVQEWEFWQGRPNRMHDRFLYTSAPAGWNIERLMP